MILQRARGTGGLGPSLFISIFGPRQTFSRRSLLFGSAGLVPLIPGLLLSTFVIPLFLHDPQHYATIGPIRAMNFN